MRIISSSCSCNSRRGISFRSSSITVLFLFSPPFLFSLYLSLTGTRKSPRDALLVCRLHPHPLPPPILGVTRSYPPINPFYCCRNAPQNDIILQAVKFPFCITPSSSLTRSLWPQSNKLHLNSEYYISSIFPFFFRGTQQQQQQQITFLITSL